MKSPLEFWVFLPQMRLTMDQLVERARAAEAAGFAGIAGMDHLTPPLAENQPMFEAMITNTWLAGQTERLRVGSLVLCDSFRHPAVLAREAVSIDHASGGRFELGIGWGSVAGELGTFGVGSQEPKVRLGRLRESLEIINALWTGEMLDYEGEHFNLHGAQQVPGPAGHIPIVIGGAGKGTMQLGRRARRLVERAHPHRRQARRDAAARGKRPLFAAGAGRIRPALRTTRRDRSDGPSTFRDRLRSSAPRPSSSTISARSRSAASSGSTCGSATSPRPTRWRRSVMPSSGSSTSRRQPRRERDRPSSRAWPTPR